MNRLTAIAPILIAALGGIWMGASTPARAALGADVGSISADAARIGAQAPSAVVGKAAVTGAVVPSVASSAVTASGSAAPYTVYTWTAPDGTLIREFASATGEVFGVAWSGPVIPDLRQLLGSYFEPYAAQLATARAARPTRGPASIETGAMVVHSGGHMRSFEGQAYLPAQLPAGVTATDIQ